MDPRSRKIVSWSISILVHTTLLFLIGRMALDHFLPAGEVDTNPTTFEVVGGPHGVQTVVPTEAKEKTIKAPAPKPETKPQEAPEVAEKEAEEPVKFLPDKNFNEVKPTEPEKEMPPEPLPEKHAATNEDQGMENTENNLSEIPKKEEEVKTVEAPVPTATPSGKAVANSLPQKTTQVAPPQTETTGDTGAPPAYGTPGTSLDISKLEEMPGNPKPSVPYKARFYKHSGTVFIRAYIRKDGRVDLPILEKSSGFSELDEEAIRVYARWRYKTNGASGWVTKPIRFNVK